MSPATKSSLSSKFAEMISLYWSLYSGGSILAFIGYKTVDRLEYFSSANASGLGIELELGQTHPSLYWV